MITKRRIEELINQGATIWSRYTDLIKKEPILIDLSSLNQENPRFKLYNDQHGLELYDYDNLLMYQLEDLYETEKDAKWASKYKRIPRIEELNLPTWEEFCELNKLVVNFEIQIIDKNKGCHLLYKAGRYINIWDTNDKKVEFSIPATEENYTTACDLCVKLFKGE